MSSIRFTRDEKTGNLYAKVGRVAVAVYYTRIGSFAWRIRDPQGEDRHSQVDFPSEREAIDDMLDNLGELLATLQVLAEAPRDDDDFA
jgi:hypothetical protein